MARNGRLPRRRLRRIYHPRHRVYLSRRSARSWRRMRRHVKRKYGISIYPRGPRSAYRSIRWQRYFWKLYKSGRGNPAAYPGTSNHGLGNAVDVATPRMAWALRQVGHKFGWSNAEGRRVDEWWHWVHVA